MTLLNRRNKGTLSQEECDIAYRYYENSKACRRAVEKQEIVLNSKTLHDKAARLCKYAEDLEANIKAELLQNAAEYERKAQNIEKIELKEKI